MPLFSPQLMNRKRNNNQPFKYFRWMLLRKKNVEIHKHSYLSIIWIFKKLNSLKSNYLTNYLQSKTTFWAKLSHSITRTVIALNKFFSSLFLSLDLSYRESTVAAPISLIFFLLDCNTDSTLKSTHSVDCWELQHKTVLLK